MPKPTISGYNIKDRLKKQKDKWDHIKIKIFCTGKEIVHRVWGHLAEWEKAFVRYTFGKLSIHRIYMELKKLAKTNQLSLSEDS